ncbi:MAG: homoserine O-acetyltransferase [Acidobacteria bacterium]|nr:homoserine O-acetyltransferase [Acidobacteriota bacterium]
METVRNLQPTDAKGGIGVVETRFEHFDEPLELRCGDTLSGFTLAWEQYGELNAARDNVVLLFHALTGSHHAAGTNHGVPGLGNAWTDEMVVGWWHEFIGPGRAIDTDHFCVICVNYIGGCYGSTGPLSIDPATGERWGPSFPRVRFSDSVRAAMRLVDRLGIDVLHAGIGPSTGGMAVLDLAVMFPERVRNVVVVAAGMEVTPLQRIHNFEQIQAIANDPRFEGGHYPPGTELEGMKIARQINHKTFVSLRTLRRRARNMVAEASGVPWYGVNHPIESYMRHQGRKFSARFDANSYLRILDAWSQFDLAAAAGAGSLREAFERCRDQRFLIFSINSDVCYYPEEQGDLMATLEEAGVSCMRIIVHSDKGHDSFLLEPALYHPHLTFLLEGRGTWPES